MGYLSGIVLAPLVSALIILFIPRRWPNAIRVVAALGSATTLVIALLVFFGYDWQQAGFQFVERYPWIPELGIYLSFGVDGISAPMVLLTGLVIFTGVVISFKIADCDPPGRTLPKSVTCRSRFNRSIDEGPVPSPTVTTLSRVTHPILADGTIIRFNPSTLARYWPTARTRTSY